MLLDEIDGLCEQAMDDVWKYIEKQSKKNPTWIFLKLSTHLKFSIAKYSVTTPAATRFVEIVDSAEFKEEVLNNIDVVSSLVRRMLKDSEVEEKSPTSPLLTEVNTCASAVIDDLQEIIKKKHADHPADTAKALLETFCEMCDFFTKSYSVECIKAILEKQGEQLTEEIEQACLEEASEEASVISKLKDL